MGTISGCSHEMTTRGALEQQMGGGVLQVVEEQWSERGHPLADRGGVWGNEDPSLQHSRGAGLL